MRKIFFLLPFYLLVFTLFSCKKVESNVNDYYPKVTTVSATVMNDGSVVVKGTIVSSGDASIDYAGFCMDTINTPTMLSNQIIATLDGTSFSATYQGFNKNNKYYFRSWATNRFGYAYGNIISLDSITAIPVVLPCSPPNNSVNIAGSGTDYITSVGSPSFTSSWDFQVESSATTMNFSFGSYPTTGIYTTISSPPSYPNQVSVSFYSGSISGTLNSGTSVYVNQIATGKWTIGICSAPWIYGSSTFYLTTKFTCPLP